MNHIKGLIIKQPWLDLILDGKKSLEIRGSLTKIRGRIALIQSGSGCVFGTVELIDSKVLSKAEYDHSEHLHCIPQEKQIPYQRICAWVLKNPMRLDAPISYVHPQGAVIWVNLPEGIV